MSSKKRIDFPPREFSSVEIRNLFMLLAEAQENIDNIGTALAALSNSSYLDSNNEELIQQMDRHAKNARTKIDKIMTVIFVEKELINGEAQLPVDWRKKILLY